MVDDLNTINYKNVKTPVTTSAPIKIFKKTSQKRNGANWLQWGAENDVF